ncbi:MAG: von Willebrand factor type A domain-containing protein [Gemmatimonadota bacterium]|nr:von Willebrand factor type A domain-containing protein [Gemmatimonadota bacterium]
MMRPAIVVAAALLMPGLHALPDAIFGGPAKGDAAVQNAAQNIAGQVRDRDTGETLAGAQVFVSGTVLGTLTDAEGRYRLRLGDLARPGASLTVTVRLIGFREESATVTLDDSASEMTLDFELEQTALSLQDLVVTGEVREGAPGKAEADVPAPPMVSTGIALRAAGMPSAHRHRERFNTESYAYIDENRWRSPLDAPLSTFSIDVDRASYSNIRRFIRDGRLPPVDAVRIEEMINYFPYDYPEADGEHPFTVSTEVARAPWNPRNLLVRVGVQGRSVDLEDLPPGNLVFLLDVSGSMHAPDKLPLLKQSMRLLVNELRAEDRVAVVVYAGAAGLVLESTSGRHKERILEAIERLEAGGSTAGGAGLRLAYDVARRNFAEGGNNRVILATDGDFNVGASSDAEMTRLIEKEREAGTFLTVLGFGMGNLKDSKMEAIADHGNGNYAYIDSALEARKVLVTEMGGTLLTIAKDVKIQVEFNPARVGSYRLIGYENRLLAAEDFNDDRVDAGELGAGHTVTALYEVVPAGAEIGDRGPMVDPLRYGPDRDADADRRASPRDEGIDVSEFADELMFVKLRYKRPDGDRSVRIDHPVAGRATEPSADMRFAAAVASFGMLLRGSEECGDFTYSDVSRLARDAVGGDPYGYRSEFVHLVARASDLSHHSR